MQSRSNAYIRYVSECNPEDERNAWWNKNELTVIDSLPYILANAMRHPFGDGEKDIEKFFGRNAHNEEVKK
jgi:hypothetical protein